MYFFSSTHLCFSHIDVELYFHGPDQFLDLSGRMGYKLYRGETWQSQITIRDTNIIERDFTAEEEDWDIKRLGKTCTNEGFDKCVYDMLARDMRDATEDHCTVPYIKDATTICTKGKDVNIASTIATNLLINGEHVCNHPCRSVTVNLGGKNYQNVSMEQQDFAVLDLYFLPLATQNNEKEMYTLLNLWSEIGGYVGLLLGYSLFSFFRWINKGFETLIERMKTD